MSARSNTPTLRGRVLEALAGAGVRCTPQRYSVLEYLLRAPVHVTAEDVFEALNRADPKASRATVYNSLRALLDARLVREVVADSRATRYEAQVEKHHHFLCDQCAAIEDIPWFAVPARTQLGGRVVRDCELVLRGLCAACAQK
jgi:Fur family transcriptional regulator, peroxide stress response regulator